MSSNRFLQRFEGKIQVVGKEGVQNVFGGKQENVIVYTNNNFNPNKNRTSNSLNKPKPNPQPPANPKLSNKKIPNEPTPPSQPHQKNPPPPPQPKEKKVENPFLISNPFYLDEEERERAEQERKEREKAEKIERQKEKQREKEAQRQAAESRKATSVNLNKSLEKKKTEKEWVKLGGLGANIGGEDWVEKKKKLDKMQQFSEQVKSINKDKPKLPKPPGQRKQDKQANTRQKALQYSKNVPKPVVRVLQQQQKEQKQEVVEEKLSELQQYELRHEQLKNMLKNQL